MEQVRPDSRHVHFGTDQVRTIPDPNSSRAKNYITSLVLGIISGLAVTFATSSPLAGALTGLAVTVLLMGLCSSERGVRSWISMPRVPSWFPSWPRTFYQPSAPAFEHFYQPPAPVFRHQHSHTRQPTGPRVGDTRHFQGPPVVPASMPAGQPTAPVIRDQHSHRSAPMPTGDRVGRGHFQGPPVVPNTSMATGDRVGRGHFQGPPVVPNTPMPTGDRVGRGHFQGPLVVPNTPMDTGPLVGGRAQLRIPSHLAFLNRR